MEYEVHDPVVLHLARRLRMCSYLTTGSVLSRIYSGVILVYHINGEEQIGLSKRRSRQARYRHGKCVAPTRSNESSRRFPDPRHSYIIFAFFVSLSSPNSLRFHYPKILPITRVRVQCSVFLIQSLRSLQSRDTNQSTIRSFTSGIAIVLRKVNSAAYRAPLVSARAGPAGSDSMFALLTSFLDLYTIASLAF